MRNTLEVYINNIVEDLNLSKKQAEELLKSTLSDGYVEDRLMNYVYTKFEEENAE